MFKPADTGRQTPNGAFDKLRTLELTLQPSGSNDFGSVDAAQLVYGWEIGEEGENPWTGRSGVKTTFSRQ